MPSNKTRNPKSRAATFGHPEAARDEPEIYVHGHRVTERDVMLNLKDLGGDALEDYRTGRMSREEAWRSTAAWLRQISELRGRL